MAIQRQHFHGSMSVAAVMAATTVAAGIVLLGGCTAFLPRREAPPEGPLPERFTIADSTQAEGKQWWHDLESEALDTLIAEALQENLTLRQLWSRLDQAGEISVQAASPLYPQLDGLGNASYTRTVAKVITDEPSFRERLRSAILSGAARGVNNALSQAGGTNGGTGGTILGSTSGSAQARTEEVPSRVITETKQFGLSLGAAYEVDLWGRIWSQYQSARFDVEATREDLEAAAMTLTAQVAELWLRILEQQELGRLLAEQLETNLTYLELVELRFRKGQVSALDVFQQRQTVSDVKRLIPLVQAAEAVLGQNLAVLLGKSPTEPPPVGDAPLPQDAPPLPPTGIPAELLANRPDVRAAMARLQSADYGVAEARADLLPAIRLTGGIGYSTNDIRYLFDNWFLNLAAGLTQPLFDGFRRQAEIDRTLAVVEERLADYRLTVLSAIQEVEEALVQEARQREYLAGLAEGLNDARNALREASQRYRKGLNDYLPVLAALERTQLLARNVVTAHRELLVFRVNLYRALGGTWMEELQPPVRLSEQKTVESPAS